MFLSSALVCCCCFPLQDKLAKTALLQVTSPATADPGALRHGYADRWSSALGCRGPAGARPGAACPGGARCAPWPYLGSPCICCGQVLRFWPEQRRRRLVSQAYLGRDGTLRRPPRANDSGGSSPASAGASSGARCRTTTALHCGCRAGGRQQPDACTTAPRPRACGGELALQGLFSLRVRDGARAARPS